MSATKILWGQILAVSTVVLALIWAATEWTAWHLGFQPQLGQPWFVLFGWPVYQPPAFFWWWFAFDAYAHEVFVEAGYASVDTGFIGQNVYLFCASEGLATVFRGAVDYPKLARALKLPDQQFVTFRRRWDIRNSNEYLSVSSWRRLNDVICRKNPLTLHASASVA